MLHRHQQPASESRSATHAAMRRLHPLFFVFFIVGASGPLVYAASLSGRVDHASLAYYVTGEITVMGIALYVGLRGRRQ